MPLSYFYRVIVWNLFCSVISRKGKGRYKGYEENSEILLINYSLKIGIELLIFIGKYLYFYFENFNALIKWFEGL